MKTLVCSMSDAFQVHAFIEKPTQAPIGHVHLLHGMAEHSGRYKSVILFFKEQGYIVTGHDHRGHGQTMMLNGTEGYFAEQDGFERVVDDVEEVLQCLRQDAEIAGLPITLLGHSMGSFIARRYVQKYPNQIDQLVLSGTGDGAGFLRFVGLGVAYAMGKKQGFKRKNKFLNAMVFGNFNRMVKNPTTKFDWISENQMHVHTYIEDPLCGEIATTQFYIDLFNGLGLIQRKDDIAKMNHHLPILLVAGDEDPVGNHGKALWKVAKQYKNSGIHDVTVLLFSTGRHELLNDESRPEVIQAVESWMKKQ